MIMVPETTFNALASQNSLIAQQKQMVPPSVVQMSDLDSQMHTIINDSSLSSEGKLAEYQQLFRRYNIIRDKEFNKPLQDEMKQQAEPKQATWPTNIILNSLPKTLTNKASLLLDHIRTYPEKFQLSDKNELVIDGQKLDGSNITDLVHEVVRNRTARGIAGAEIFAKGLSETNVPIEALADRNRLDLLQTQASPRNEGGWGTPGSGSPLLAVRRLDLSSPVSPEAEELVDKLKKARKGVRNAAAAVAAPSLINTWSGSAGETSKINKQTKK